jgi:hypothetical protein
MAGTDKIEPRLQLELARLETTKQQDYRIPVIIQLLHELGPLAPKVASGADKLGETRAQADGRDLLERLARMGTEDDLNRLELANSIETHLNPAQIREIAAHPDVKRVIWNREEHVTA